MEGMKTKWGNGGNEISFPLSERGLIDNANGYDISSNQKPMIRAWKRRKPCNYKYTMVKEWAEEEEDEKRTHQGVHSGEEESRADLDLVFIGSLETARWGFFAGDESGFVCASGLGGSTRLVACQTPKNT